MDGPMPGGNMNSVRRVGDTVVRTAGPWTPTIHRYLDHLRARGIHWVPRAIAADASSETLSFVRGSVPVYPLPDYVWTDSALADAARQLRSLHDASMDFDAAKAVWQLPSHPPVEVICHNDFAPHNLVFTDGRVVGAIDFDTCSPGSRMWDIAYLATRMVPLTADYPVNAPAEAHSRRRVQVLLDSYGSSAPWTEVVRVAVIRLRDLAEFSLRKADTLANPNLRDDAAGYERDAIYLESALAGKT